jgi:antitoxin component of RelBE/YafQ-DinJ toxin-antitoxin module
MATLNIRLSKEEHKKITEDAVKLGLTVSEYIRFITKNVNIKVELTP